LSLLQNTRFIFSRHAGGFLSGIQSIVVTPGNWIPAQHTAEMTSFSPDSRMNGSSILNLNYKIFTFFAAAFVKFFLAGKACGSWLIAIFAPGRP